MFDNKFDSLNTQIKIYIEFDVDATLAMIGAWKLLSPH